MLLQRIVVPINRFQWFLLYSRRFVKSAALWDRLSAVDVTRLQSSLDAQNGSVSTVCLDDLQARVRTLGFPAFDTEHLCQVARWVARHAACLSLSESPQAQQRAAEFLSAVCCAIGQNLPLLTSEALSHCVTTFAQEFDNAFQSSTHKNKSCLVLFLRQYNPETLYNLIKVCIEQVRLRTIQSKATPQLVAAGLRLGLYAVEHCPENVEWQTILQPLAHTVVRYAATRFTAHQLYAVLLTYHQTGFFDQGSRALSNNSDVFLKLQQCFDATLTALIAPTEDAASSAPDGKPSSVDPALRGLTLLTFEQHVALINAFATRMPPPLRQPLFQAACERLEKETALGVPFTAELLRDFVMGRHRAKAAPLLPHQKSLLVFLLQRKMEYLSTMDLCKLVVAGLTTPSFLDGVEYWIFSRAKHHDELLLMPAEDVLHVVRFLTRFPVKQKGIYHFLREALLFADPESAKDTVKTRLEGFSLEQRLTFIILWCRQKLVDPVLFDAISCLCEVDYPSPSAQKVRDTTFVAALTAVCAVGYRHSQLLNFFQHHVEFLDLQFLPMLQLLQIAEAGQVLGIKWARVEDKIKQLFPEQPSNTHKTGVYQGIPHCHPGGSECRAVRTRKFDW